jgi:hypothetical protein
MYYDVIHLASREIAEGRDSAFHDVASDAAPTGVYQADPRA